MSEHFTLDELAELDAGLLARRRASRADRHRATAAAAHIADCEECSARAEALRKTQESLRDLGPVQMPADVTARLDRALGEAASSSGSDVVPDLGAYRASRLRGLPPWSYAAAAAVVVLGATAIIVGTLHNNKSNDRAAAGSAPIVATETPSTALLLQQTGRTYSPTSIAGLVSGLTNGSAGSQALAATAPDFAAGSTTNGEGASAGDTHASKSTSGASGPATAAVPAPVRAGPLSPTIAPSLRHLADSRDALLRCAAFITDTPDAAPIAVDFGRWTNAAAGIHRVPAVVFVFAKPDDANTIEVFVVAAACDDASLLDFQVLDKTP